MTIYEVQTFRVATNATRYELLTEIAPGQGRTALLFVHGLRASTNAEPVALTVDGWQPVGAATATTTNRRYAAAAFALPEPPPGAARIVVTASKPLNGLVAFLYLADNATPGVAVGASGEGGAVTVPGPFVGPVLIGAMSRPGARIEPDAGEVIARGETTEADATTRVTAALISAADVAAVMLSGRAVLALAVPLVVPAPPPPTEPRHEISVVVRELDANTTHEVRVVRPGDIVAGRGGIDWEATPYQSYTLVNVESQAAT